MWHLCVYCCAFDFFAFDLFRFDLKSISVISVSLISHPLSVLRDDDSEAAGDQNAKCSQL